jgi:hypothetical protein
MDEILLKINHLYDFLGGHFKKGEEGLWQKLYQTGNLPELGSKKISRKCTKFSFSTALSLNLVSSNSFRYKLFISRPSV